MRNSQRLRPGPARGTELIVTDHLGMVAMMGVSTDVIHGTYRTLQILFNYAAHSLYAE